MVGVRWLLLPRLFSKQAIAAMDGGAAPEKEDEGAHEMDRQSQKAPAIFITKAQDNSDGRPTFNFAGRNSFASDARRENDTL